VSAERLVHLGRLLFDQPELHGLVAVALVVLRLQHDARTRLDDGRRRDGAVSGEHLGHPDFSTDDSVDHY
jgi:hypothetical protein